MEPVTHPEGIEVTVRTRILPTVTRNNDIFRIAGHTAQCYIRLRNTQSDQIVARADVRRCIIVGPIHVGCKVYDDRISFCSDIGDT